MRRLSQLLLAVALLELGSGIQGVLLPYRAQLAGFHTQTIGLMGSAYYIGFVAGCLAVPAVISRIGHIRAFSGFAALAAAIMIGHGLAVWPPLWVGLRTGLGLCFAGIYLAVESWLNNEASDETRGRVLAVYVMVSWAGVIAGKLTFGMNDPRLLTPFALAGLAVTLAVAPIAFTTVAQPPQPPPGRLHLAQIYRRAPVALVGCILVGAANGAFWSLAPVFLAGQDQTPLRSGLFVALAVGGGAVAQWPLGALSDRTDRRIVILVAALAAASVAATLGLAHLGGDSALFGLGIAFGAAALPLYSLCVAHANDKVTAEDFVEVSSGPLTAFGIGAIVGPMLASGLMTVQGPGGIFVFTAAAHLALGLHSGARLLIARPVPEPLKEPFVAVPKSTQAAIDLDPRTPASAGDIGFPSVDPPGPGNP